MKNLFKFLREGILDIGDLEAKADTFVAETWAKENLKGTYKLRRLKNGHFKFSGTVILSKYDGTDFGGIVIDDLDGSLFVEDCPNLTSLNGLFDRWGLDGPDDVRARVSGDIKITQCKSFNSLEGIPGHIDGEFVCVVCPALRSLEHAPVFVADVTLVKVGKKFKEAQIKNHFKCATRIMCSMEERENMIVEAMSEPHLLKFWDWIKKTYQKLRIQREQTAKEENWRLSGPDDIQKLSLKDLTRFVRFDLIRPSDVKVYDNHNDKVKDIRKALLDFASSAYSMLIVKKFDPAGDFNVDDDYSYEYFAMSNGSGATGWNLIAWQNGGTRQWSYGSSISQQWRKMEIVDLAGRVDGTVREHRQFIIIKVSDMGRFLVQRERTETRRGMILTSAEVKEWTDMDWRIADPKKTDYNKILVQQNLKRYRDIIAKARAEGASTKYLTLASGFEKLLQRYAKLPDKLKDPDWLKSVYYKEEMRKIPEYIKSIQGTLFVMMSSAYFLQGKPTTALHQSAGKAMEDAEKHYRTAREHLQTLANLLTTVGL